MSSLTVDQLIELSDRINSRLEEFEAGLSRLSLGAIRTAYDVIEEWEGEKEPDRVAQRLSDINVTTEMWAKVSNSGWQRGYEEGYAEAVRTQKWAEANADVEAPHTYPDGAPRPPLDAFDQAVEDAKREMGGADNEETLDDYDPMLDFGSDDPNAPATPLSREVAATLGPEHTMVTPLVPRRSLPDPDQARENVATLLANGVEDGLNLGVLGKRKPRTLAEVDAATGPTKHRMTRPEQRAAKLKGPERKGADPTLNEVIVALQRMAMGGKMPLKTTWDETKPVGWPVATTLCSRLEMGWQQLAQEAELTPNRK